MGLLLVACIMLVYFAFLCALMLITLTSIFTTGQAVVNVLLCTFDNRHLALLDIASVRGTKIILQ